MTDDKYRIFVFKNDLVAQLGELADAGEAVDAVKDFMTTVTDPGLLIIAPPGSVTPEITGHIDQVDASRGLMSIVADRAEEDGRHPPLRAFARRAARALARPGVAAKAAAAAGVAQPGRERPHYLDDRG